MSRRWSIAAVLVALVVVSLAVLRMTPESPSHEAVPAEAMAKAQELTARLDMQECLRRDSLHLVPQFDNSDGRRIDCTAILHDAPTDAERQRRLDSLAVAATRGRR